MRLIDADKLRALYTSRRDAARGYGGHCGWCEAQMWQYAVQMLDGQMTVCARSAGHTAKEQTERCVQCGYTSDVGWEYCPHCGHWKYWGKE